MLPCRRGLFTHHLVNMCCADILQSSLEVAGQNIAVQVGEKMDSEAIITHKWPAAHLLLKSQVNICVSSSVFVCLFLTVCRVFYTTKMGQEIQGKPLLASLNHLI